MYDTHPHSLSLYRSWCALLSTLLLVVCAGGAFGISWLRHETTRMAEACAVLEREIAVQSRDNANLEVRVARVHSAEYLIANAPVGLRPTQEEQIAWVQPVLAVPQHIITDTPELLAAYDGLRPVNTPERNPLTVTFDHVFVGLAAD
jgi:hypothetical protein